MMSRTYPVRCPLCGRGHIKIHQRKIVTHNTIKEYVIKKGGSISVRGHYLSKTIDVKEFWVLNCGSCSWSELTTGPDPNP